MNIDTQALPQKGNKIRIRIRRDLWLITQVESIAPSMTFITLKVLGMKEDADEEPGIPTRLVDESDPLGAVEAVPTRREALPSRPVRKHDPDLPPSPSVIIEEEEKEQNEIPF